MAMPGDVLTVYVTAASEEEAERIGRAAVAERLAACANLLPGMRSIYRWEGRLETAVETVLLLKTRRPLLEALTRRIAELHGYRVPCIVAWPVVGGHPGYLGWVAAETDGPADP